jgi:SAM-dependent methyltransferase
MSIDEQTFGELLRARDAFADHAAPLCAVILGDCSFTTDWATGDNRHDLAEFARRMNLARVETLDIAGNPTLRADITGPLPSGLFEAFDMVFDIGTLYWVFDTASAWRNCLTMLKPRGLIAHYSALTGYFGRGYYNFHPRLFSEFYAANNFENVVLKVRLRKFFEDRSWWRRLLLRLYPASRDFVPLPLKSRFLNNASWRYMDFRERLDTEAMILPNDADIFCVASREAARPFTKPILFLG